jgi:two-component system CheB/CheR fusion protein
MKANKEKSKILSSNLFPVVGIGASAGGLDAFKKLLRAIPENSGMAYVLVQHLDPTHESLLPEILQKVTSIPVLEVSDDIKVQPNNIYVIPSNKMMVANDGVLELTTRPEKTKSIRNLPIDLFFTSLAEVHQTHAIGVVLSGTASDGTLGLKSIKDHGGITFAQDEESAAYEGMPNSAVQAGVVDFVLPPEKIPEKLLELTKIITTSDGIEQNLPLEDEEVFKQIISLLRIRKGTDFTYYKQTTIRRRILRRMALNKNDEPVAYLKYLRENKTEQDVLYQDLLIPVTSFFRDSKTFDNLFETVFPLIVKNKSAGETIRVWVAGCSTGEEAYSIAICFREFLGDHPMTASGERVQIFATDISEPAIAKARMGIYTKIELASVPLQRLKEFFTKTNGSYQVNKQVRDMCVFATHNFLKDPPFGKIDFISCRNVLIYMEPYLQKKALTTFHYALNPKGSLLLGKSETISSVPDLFAPSAKNDKLFSRKDVPGRFMHIASQRSEKSLAEINTGSNYENKRTDFQKTADDIILSKYTPAGVVINEAMDIVHFRGSTGNYLEPSPGKASLNLLKMAKQGLVFELRNILHKAKKDNAPVIKENIPLIINGSPQKITIEAMPLPNVIEPHYLILFHNYASPLPAKPGPSIKRTKEEKVLRIQQLEQELLQTREDMRSITEDQEAANEELQSANEELLSGSEELQSLNEELETSKEELQSTNEELTVVNEEMIGLNEQVTAARDYAEAIIINIREPLLVLDKNLRIKTANNSFYKTFRVNEHETEGVLIYEIGNKQWNIPALRTLLEKILPEKSMLNDFEVTHTFSIIGERVMLLNAREVINNKSSEKLILLSIEDITERVLAGKKIEESEKQFRQMAELMPQKVWTADAGGNKNYFNQKWFDYTGLSFEELKDWGWARIIHPDDWEKTKRQWQESIDTGKDYEMENRLLRKDGKYLWHLTRAIALKDDDGKIKIWLGSKTEIQEQREQKQELEKAVQERTSELQKTNEELEEKNNQFEKINKELESFSYVASHDLQEPLRKIQTFAHRILEKENQNLSDKGKDYFKRIQSAVARMQQLIEDLLSFSHISMTERNFEYTELNTIVEEVKTELKEIIEEKHATIEATELCPANIIPFQFRQLMYNLIGNALKFSKTGDILPHIIINSKIEKGSELSNELKILHGFSPGKNYCHITVNDNGIGFDPQYKDQIFEVFQRLHGKDEYSGTGIGLAIVKKIVENHSGIITVTSELDKGATFDIYIPA